MIVDTVDRARVIPGICILADGPWYSNAVWEAAADALSRPDTGLVLIPRELPVDLADAVAHASPQRVRGPIAEESVRGTMVSAVRTLGLPVETLASDCALISRLFFSHFQPASTKMRLEIIDEQPCPKFHCDHVFARLLCTYCGPTTQYCAPGSEAAAESFGIGWLGILKGSKHPAHDSVRVLHRSPPMPAGERRLSFALDW